MPKQRMAGYVPLKGAPAETEPAPAPAQDTTTAAPASAAAAVPVAPTAPTSGLTPLSARRRMAGYVPFAREAEWLGGAPAPAAGSIPAAAPARSVAPEPIAASASPTRAPAPAETEPVVPDVAAAVAASATGAPAAAGVGAPVESDLVPLAKRRRMAGYVPFAREGEWFTELATVGAATGTLRLLGTDRDSGLGPGVQPVGVLVLRDLGAAVIAGTGDKQRRRGQAAGTLCSAHHCACSRRHWASRRPPSVPL